MEAGLFLSCMAEKGNLKDMKSFFRHSYDNRIGIAAVCGLFSLILCFLPAVNLSAQEEPAPAIQSAEEDAPPSGEESDSPAPATEELPADNLVIVLDPGHGGVKDDGSPEGGVYDGLVEKELNLIVAAAMKEELEKYENVTVYLTRTGDEKLSLEERVNFAKSVDADFLFCLHFNLSKEHNSLFGAECWVSAFGRYYSEGYAFADIEMEALEKLGLYSRGIKTRLNDRGTDYYGIIRLSVEQDLPCVLIEHCHMDHANDRPFCEEKSQWEAFGRLDATSAAKYFHLKSDALGVDYSDYQTLQVPVPEGVMRPDTTEPDVCMIEVTEQEMETGLITVELSAADYDSGMLYYDYSYDGGETFSPRLAWGDKTQDTITFTMQAPPHIIPQIVVRGYNGYDLFTQSNLVSLPSMDYKTEEEIAAELAQKEAAEAAARAEADAARAGAEKKAAEKKTTIEVRRTPKQEEKKDPSLRYFLTVCLVCALTVIGMALSMALIIKSRKRRRRGRRRSKGRKR